MLEQCLRALIKLRAVGASCGQSQPRKAMMDDHVQVSGPVVGARAGRRALDAMEEGLLGGPPYPWHEPGVWATPGMLPGNVRRG